ncbi:hypothetical protein AO073_01580 [Pseudomonas syringae ICMP 11293]|uniref:hypothetical protein n=1 Tax=Pseudomonas syringae TaxID=317 RepID=UPI000731C885|nr:hypothetical protein [Pseudomonas syringae]KTB91591.1 hypothetical protein AO073_01580 [Pseudomonas syringae ICMP 11293]
MKSQLQLLNEKNVFFAETAVLDMRLRVRFLLDLKPKDLVRINRKLHKITHKFALSPSLKKGFYVDNDSISVAILNAVSDEIIDVEKDEVAQ